MPRLRDIPGAYERANDRITDFARQLGIDRGVIVQYVNDKAHLPQTLDELRAWGRTPNKNYPAFTPLNPDGSWNVLRPGDTPGTLGAKDPGFRHVITNNVDQLEQFLDVDPSGDIWGGSWDPAYNAAHAASGQNGGVGPGNAVSGNTMRGSASTFSAQARSFDPNNYVAPAPSGGGRYVSVVDGVPVERNSQAEAEQDFNTRTGGASTPPSASPGAPASPGDTPATGTGTTGGTTGSVSSGLGPLVDAAAYGNTQTLQAQIDDAIRRYALARTAEERNQAYMDLQRWQTELGKAQHDQSRYDAMAQALLSASVQLQNSPKDYFKFNQMTSGGRDIFAQMQQAGPAFAGPTGPVEPGSVGDLMARLGIGPSPATPATPAGVLPGAANPSNPGLPAIPVPGSAGVPGALQPGAGGTTPGATATSLPAYEQMLRELDAAAGGSWGGNRADRQAVATNWWNADPARRGKQMPGWS